MDTVIIGGKPYTIAQLQQMAGAGELATGQKNDPFSTTLTMPSPHGFNPGNPTQLGVYSGTGVRPGMWSATPRVRTFASMLPMRKNQNREELIEMETGVTQGSGTNTKNTCAAAPIPGDLKVMRQVYTYGMLHMDTRVADVTLAGFRNNYAEMDRELYNTATVDNPFLPDLSGIEGGGRESSTFRSEVYKLGIELERSTSVAHFAGTAGTENNVYRGVPIQWSGLDQFIKTGYTDSVTSVVTPAADSAVQTFNAPITGTDSSGRNIYWALNDLVFGLRSTVMAVSDVLPTYMIVMRPEAFREAVRLWAGAYQTYQVFGATTSINAVMTTEALQASRQAMEQGRYLVMDDGSVIPVFLDNSMPQVTIANQTYESDIYVVAMEWGGRPLIWFDYFDMGNDQATELVNATGPDTDTIVTNDGLYRVFRLKQGGCVQFKFVARTRLMLDAPFVHGRLDNVRYTGLAGVRNPIPGQSNYVNGGTSYRVLA